MTHHETKHETTMMITPILGHPSCVVGTPIHLSAWYYHAQGAPSPPLADRLKYHHGHSPLDDDGPIFGLRHHIYILWPKKSILETMVVD